MEPNVANPPADPEGCEVCGQPTSSQYRICRATPECRREYMRRYRRSHRKKARARQGPRRDPEKTRAYQAAYRQANREKIRGQQAAWREANRETLLAQKATARREAAARGGKAAQRKADPEAVREQRRLRRLRNDLPCAYSKFGCTNLKVRNSRFCRPHRKAAERRREQRQHQAMKRRCAEVQSWICTWCDLPLPGDLEATHLDHVIPKAVTMTVLGRVINEAWNLDVLHAACNIAKGGSLTLRAVALSAEHGIDPKSRPSQGRETLRTSRARKALRSARFLSPREKEDHEPAAAGPLPAAATPGAPEVLACPPQGARRSWRWLRLPRCGRGHRFRSRRLREDGRRAGPDSDDDPA